MKQVPIGTLVAWNRFLCVPLEAPGADNREYRFLGTDTQCKMGNEVEVQFVSESDRSTILRKLKHDAEDLVEQEHPFLYDSKVFFFNHRVYIGGDLLIRKNPEQEVGILQVCLAYLDIKNVNIVKGYG